MSHHALLIIGCGSIGERHLRCFLRTGRAAVAACEPNAPLRERIAREYGVPVAPSLDAALDAGPPPDGAVVATPAHTHLEIAARLLDRGAALLIEKPLATSEDGLDRFVDRAAGSGRPVALAYVYHCVPGLQAMRRRLRDGSFGPPLQVAVVTGQHFPTFRPAYRAIYYARHETGGGAIQDALTHLANAVEWMIGPATRVFAEAAHQHLEGVTVEDCVCVTARHGPVLAGYALNQFQAPNEMSIQIHCAGGSLRYEHHAQRWGEFARGAADWTWHDAPIRERDELFVAQANSFLDALEGSSTPLATLDEGVRTLRFNLAALRSAREGIAVELP